MLQFLKRNPAFIRTVATVPLPPLMLPAWERFLRGNSIPFSFRGSHYTHTCMAFVHLNLPNMTMDIATVMTKILSLLSLGHDGFLGADIPAAWMPFSVIHLSRLSHLRLNSISSNNEWYRLSSRSTSPLDSLSSSILSPSTAMSRSFSNHIFCSVQAMFSTVPSDGRGRQCRPSSYWDGRDGAKSVRPVLAYK